MKGKKRKSKQEIDLNFGCFPSDIWGLILCSCDIYVYKYLPTLNKSFDKYCKDILLPMIKKRNGIKFELNYSQMIWLMFKKEKDGNYLYGSTRKLYELLSMFVSDNNINIYQKKIQIFHPSYSLFAELLFDSINMINTMENGFHFTNIDNDLVKNILLSGKHFKDGIFITTFNINSPNSLNLFNIDIFLSNGSFQNIKGEFYSNSEPFKPHILPLIIDFKIPLNVIELRKIARISGFIKIITRPNCLILQKKNPDPTFNKIISSLKFLMPISEENCGESILAINTIDSILNIVNQKSNINIGFSEKLVKIRIDTTIFLLAKIKQEDNS